MRPSDIGLLVEAADREDVLRAAVDALQVPGLSGGVVPEDGTERLVAAVLSARNMRQRQRAYAQRAKRSKEPQRDFSLLWTSVRSVSAESMIT